MIFLGFIKLELYYGNWGIEIISYLDLSEIILSFLNDVDIIILFVFLMVFQMIAGFLTINAIDKRNENKRKALELVSSAQPNLNQSENIPVIQKRKTVDETLDEAFKKYPAVLWIVGLLWIIVSTGMFFWKMSLVWLYIDFIAFIQALPILLDKLLKGRNITVVLQLTIIITFLAFVFCKAKYDIYHTEKQPQSWRLTTIDNAEVLSS